jgi:N-acetyl-anhydromuramyl-L-alanine amidase AmpD
MRTALTPNYTRGKYIEPKGIILHHTAGSWGGSVSWITDKASKVSYHAAVNTNGDIFGFGPDCRRMWHACNCYINGRKNCNDFMLGIAVTGDTNRRTLTIEETKAVAQWCVSKMKLYNFGIDMITTHRHVSPGRKNDVDVRSEKAIKDEINRLINL